MWILLKGLVVAMAHGFHGNLSNQILNVVIGHIVQVSF